MSYSAVSGLGLHCLLKSWPIKCVLGLKELVHKKYTCPNIGYFVICYQKIASVSLSWFIKSLVKNKSLYHKMYKTVRPRALIIGM